MIYSSLLVLLGIVVVVNGFTQITCRRPFQPCSVVGIRRHAKEPENPYQDESYPDLEFIDYSDPNYVVDQGVTEEMFQSDDAKIEEMREDRRRRNDEFQFETYFAEVLKGGDTYNGEWTVYKSSTFLEDAEDDASTGLPRLLRVKEPMKVTSRGYKIKVESDSQFRVDGERICHEESIVEGSEELKTYWPEQTKAHDFRGHQGIMCVGNAHTICTYLPLVEDSPEFEGPFAEMRTEIGIFGNDMRMRVKLDFAVLENEKEDFANDKAAGPPPLHLKSMMICREGREFWPKNGSEAKISEGELVQAEALFGIPGAPGGLYDPPPVGSDEQATRYMMLDLEGGATVLFPYLVDQDPDAFGGKGWVTSLDWTPGRIRYQVDRKVLGGTKLLGLRTLELSEVQGTDAATYRPKDGGQNMRQ